MITHQNNKQIHIYIHTCIACVVIILYQTHIKMKKKNFFYFCKLIMNVIDATGVSEQRNGVKNDLDIKHILTEKS